MTTARRCCSTSAPPITEAQRQFVGVLASMCGCDTPIVFMLSVIRGVGHHLVPESVNDSATPESLASLITDLARRSGSDLRAVSARGMDDNMSDSVFLFRYDCSEPDYTSIVKAALETINLDRSSFK